MGANLSLDHKIPCLCLSLSLSGQFFLARARYNNGSVGPRHGFELGDANLSLSNQASLAKPLCHPQTGNSAIQPVLAASFGRCPR